MKKNLMKYLSSNPLEYIGYNYILGEFSPITPYGIKIKNSLRTYKIGEEKELTETLKIIYSLKNLLEEDKKSFTSLELCLMEIRDVSLIITKLKASICLDEVELFEIKRLIMALNKLNKLWDISPLKELIPHLSFIDLSEVLRLLDPDRLSLPTFFIYDSYSEKLKDIRERKRNLEGRLLRANLSDDLEKLKASRNEIVSEELEEELLIRQWLTESLSSSALSIEKNISCLTELDLYLAKARLALIGNSTLPSIIERGAPKIQGATNPYIEKQLKKKGLLFTPMSLSLEEGTTVITGANMGGKTVTLKTLALNILLVHLGFLPFCQEMELSLLDYIYLNAQEAQDVEKSLSSFTGEILSLKEALSYGEEHRGLLLLDEFARGTNPQEGTVLCRSLTEYLSDKKIISVIATHYNGVAEKASVHYQCIGLKQASEEALNKALSMSTGKSHEIIQGFMNYSLVKVPKNLKVPEEAIKLCRLLDFNKEILAKASKEYNQGDFSYE